MKRQALIIPILLTVTFLSTTGKENKKTFPKVLEYPKFSTKVQLQIGGYEKIIDEVNSYISRELRSLVDVHVVRNDSDWILNIHASQTKDAPPGFILSIVILKPFNLGKSSFIKELFEGRINEIDCKTLEQLTNNTYWFEDHAVGSGSNLQSVCQRVVTYFDVKVLERERENYQEYVKSIQQKWQSMTKAEKKELMMNKNDKKRLTIREMVEKKKAEGKQKE